MCSLIALLSFIQIKKESVSQVGKDKKGVTFCQFLLKMVV